MIVAPSVCQQHETGGYESLAAVGGEKIRTFANHFDGPACTGGCQIGGLTLFV